MNNTHKTSTNVEEFVKDYINAWSTTDAGARKALVANVYADDVDFYANEPGDGPSSITEWQTLRLISRA